MFNWALQWLELNTGTDPMALLVICGLCTVGAYMTKDAMANPNGKFLIYPMLVACAVFVNWAFMQTGYFDMKRMDSWLQAVSCASVLGMIMGLTIFILINKTLNAFADRSL